MCLHILPLHVRPQASLREEREWHYFLTEPCTAWPEEGEYCGQRTHHCIYLPFPCPECGGPQDPRSRPSELEESKTLIWHIQDREVQVVFGEVNWAGPRADAQEGQNSLSGLFQGCTVPRFLCGTLLVTYRSWYSKQCYLAFCILGRKYAHDVPHRNLWGMRTFNVGPGSEDFQATSLPA